MSINDETVSTVKIKHPGGHAVINASDFDPTQHEKFDEPAPLPPPPAPLPPPPVKDPLGLPANWRDKDTGELRKLAEIAGNGRAVENRKQAIEVIEGALKRKG